MPVRWLLPLFALLPALSACAAEPVTVSAPELSVSDQAACAALLGDLPDRLAGEDRREVTPTGAGAAWGDPAMTVTCGGEMPPEFTDDSGCEEIAGVGWFVPDAQLTDQSVAATITTIGFDPIVTVVLPVERRTDSAGVLTDLAGPIKQHLNQTASCL